MAKKQQPVSKAPAAARPKTDRLTRAAILAWVVVAVLVLMSLIKVIKSVGLVSFAGSVSPGVCRALPLERTRESLTELRFFIEAWANSRAVVVDVAN